MRLHTQRTGASSTLVTTFNADAETSAAVRVGAVVFIAAATAAAAQLSFALGGAALGSRLGMAAQLVYLAAGIVGLPVFAASAVLPQGVLRLLGPTGGYLLSYPLAAFLVGRLAERGFDRRYLTSVLAMIAGLAVIFTFGVTWLAFFARPAALGLDAALSAGLYPFLPGDILKILAGAAILPVTWKFLVGNR